MSQRVLLLTPDYHSGVIEITGKWPPLSLVYLAGSLRKAGHQVRILDLMTENITFEQALPRIKSFRPEIVMIGAYTASINAALEVLRQIRQNLPKAVTVLGGIHATFCYQEILENCSEWVDYIVYGEGEQTCTELLKAIEGEMNPAEVTGLVYMQDDILIKTPPRPLVEDLGQLTPAWDLLNWEDYYYRITGDRLAVVSSSRGCPHNCSFCSQHKFWCSTYRTRTPSDFVDELVLLKERFGVRMCMLADEYPTYEKERWEQILDLIISRNLNMHFSLETRAEDIVRDQDILHKYRQAGIIHVYVGVESAHQSVLDLYQKNVAVHLGRKAITLLNEVGIVTECSFILGHPDETTESIQQTLKLAIEYNPDLAHFLLITPWPYADIYDQVKDYIKEKDYSRYHLVYPIIEPRTMTREQLWKQVIKCFGEFYSHKMKQYRDAAPGFKKEYMMKSMELMHKEFFANRFGKKAIQQPPEMVEVMSALFSGISHKSFDETIG